MHNHNVIVANNVATYRLRDGHIVCGNSDHQIIFTFDFVWEAYADKIARFKWNDGFQDVPIVGNTVKIPIITNSSQIEVGVYVDGLHATTAATIPCKEDNNEES